MRTDARHSHRRPSAAWIAGCAFALLWWGVATSRAESGAYRVEVLVFRHDTGELPEARETDRISEFPGAWRLSDPHPVIVPEDPAPLGVMSDQMRDIWRRLEGSAAYTPLLFRAWEQSRIDYHPPVRLHDDELLAQRSRWPADAVIRDLDGGDSLMHEPLFFYRLDGTAQLRRARFLHLAFDLEYRHRLIDPPEKPAANPPPARPLALENEAAASPAMGDDQAEAVPGALVHRLRETRQIRSGEMLYFDTPYLGALARVTETAGE